MPNTEPIAIPEENLYNIPSAIAKSIEVTGENIHGKIVSHHLAQTINGFTHICAADCDINLYPTRKHHDLPPSTATTSASVLELKLLSTPILIPDSRSIVSPESFIDRWLGTFGWIQAGTGTKRTAESSGRFSFLFQ